MNYRPLGDTGLNVSAVALGCWPMAGITSPGTNDADSLATIAACFDLGINHLDTAYMYGYHGESERLIARALRGRRHEMIVATKGGLHWDVAGKQMHDASPETLRRECEKSLRRLETDVIDLYYLHAPDENVPLAESAGELNRLREEGKVRCLGASNLTLAQLEQFAVECPLCAYQPPYNMLMRQAESDILPWCRAHHVAVLVYWPLMKGLLAGKLGRDHVFDARDSRRKYPMFQGEEWQKNLDLVERLRAIAAAAGRTVTELVIAWTIHQPGITAAVCGAKRPEQIGESAAACGWRLSEAELVEVDAALAARGTPTARLPV